MRLRTAAVFVLVAACAGPPVAAAASSTPRALYTQALARERALRDGSKRTTLAQMRSAVAAYETVVRKYPASGYCDNALWQAANLSLLAFDRFGQAADKRTGLRLLSQLAKQYPSSSLADGARETMRQREGSIVAAAPAPSRPSPASAPPVTRPRAARSEPLPRFMPPVLSDGLKPILPTPPSTPGQASPSAKAMGDKGVRLESDPGVTPKTPPAVAATIGIRDVKRTPLPDGIRVTIEMDGESTYHSEQIENPRRVFFDLRGTKPSAALQDASLKFTDDIVREIRFGRHPNATRVVMDMAGAESYSVFTLYDPFRLVVDFKRSASAAPPAAPAVAAAPASVPATPVVTPGPVSPPRTRRPIAAPPAAPPLMPPTAAPAVSPAPVRQLPGPELETAPAPAPEAKPVRSAPDARPMLSRPITSSPPPTLPAANLDGKFSLARQLGLGIARIVIDAGHGGHDPGAKAGTLAEAELTLDVALRLQRLLQKQPGVEVVMTRETDVFIPLEERTAIANREGADLFLSIHANASRNAKARGVETYFLNFASNPEAEAVAARENAGSGQTMHRLPEIVRAIALNNKLDESRDFAEMVQKAMVRRLGTRNKQLRDLGVKQAPFVVLIGAEMPSVLAEISFVTNRQEGSLLKTGAYRQQIAESLLDAVLKYQQSLKKLRGGAATQAMTK